MLIAMVTWLTEERVTYLSAWKGVGKADQWPGVYRDGYGGELRIVERGGKLHLTLHVVRGPTHHPGIIGGTGVVNGGMAWFSKEGEGALQATWLTLLNNRKRDGRIEVIGENTRPYHGARAYFDGHYLRVSLLSGKASEKVVEEAAKGGFSE